MSKHKVLVADPIADTGIEELKADDSLDVDVRIGISEEELLKDAEIYEAIIVRSQTKITADVISKSTKLKIVGRAGVGVDNIAIPAATKNGVIVMNTPAGKYHFDCRTCFWPNGISSEEYTTGACNSHWRRMGQKRL